MILYCYDPDSLEVLCAIAGGTKALLEAYAKLRVDRDGLAWSYSPTGLVFGQTTHIKLPPQK